MICSFYVMRNKDIYYYYYLILFFISRLHCRKSLFNVFGMKPSLGAHEDIVTSLPQIQWTLTLGYSVLVFLQFFIFFYLNFDSNCSLTYLQHNHKIGTRHYF